MILLVVTLLVVGTLAHDHDNLSIDVPSSVHNRSLSIKGQLFCGNKPYEGAKVRLFRVYQKNAADDLSQLLGSVQTYVTGHFSIEGNTAHFPASQTEVVPFVTFHHACDLDAKEKANKGYKRWAVRIPEDYVTLGSRARKTYDFGKINLQLEHPGETHDKKFNWNEIVTIRGHLFCGSLPLEGARVRLFHSPQMDGTDDHLEIVGSNTTDSQGEFWVEGRASLFPLKDYHPFVTIHHDCDTSEADLKKLGHRRISFKVPEDYVSEGPTSPKEYELLALNLALTFPSEGHDLSFNPNW